MTPMRIRIRSRTFGIRSCRQNGLVNSTHTSHIFTFFLLPLSFHVQCCHSQMMIILNKDMCIYKVICVGMDHARALWAICVVLNHNQRQCLVAPKAQKRALPPSFCSIFIFYPFFFLYKVTLYTPLYTYTRSLGL